MNRKDPLSAGPRIQCLTCNTIIQSLSVHHLTCCKCPHGNPTTGTKIWVDGGDHYLHMSWDDKARWKNLDNNDKELNEDTPGNT